MFTHLPTGKEFENRKQAKLYYGHAKYNKMVKNGEFSRHQEPQKEK